LLHFGNLSLTGIHFAPERTYIEWVEDYAESITRIKTGIANQDLSTAAEEWFTLPEEAKLALWKAPSKGGCFSTQEIAVIKSTEFRQAHYGPGTSA